MMTIVRIQILWIRIIPYHRDSDKSLGVIVHVVSTEFMRLILYEKQIHEQTIASPRLF